MKKILIILIGSLFLSLGFSANAGATYHHSVNRIDHAHAKDWDRADKEKVKEMEKLGFEKHDIFHAIQLSKLANIEVESILIFHKENKSWKETAEHFGVDPQKIKHHGPWKKYNKHLEDNKEKIVPYLASYLNKEEAELYRYLQDGTKVHILVKASIISKLSTLEVKEIIDRKKEGESFRDIAEELKIEKKDLYKEMKKIKAALKL